MPTLPKDFKEFIELLNKNNVRYVVIGGYAVVYHGYVSSWLMSARCSRCSATTPMWCTTL